MILTKGQEEAIKVCTERYRNREPFTVIAGPAGSGKAQPEDTLIPTPSGKRRLGDLKVGDYVFDRMGYPTKVLGVYPQGMLDCYKVELSDGRVTYCNDEHLWTCYTSKNNFITKSLREIMDNGVKRISKGGRSRYPHCIPTSHAIEYSFKEYDIDPYVIGTFLGNGCCLEKQLTLSSDDEENVAEVARLIGAKKYYKQSDKNYNWTFYLNAPETNQHNVLILKFLTKTFFRNTPELLCMSRDKRIPKEYFYGSVQQRLNLIQGLMDTDGHINKNDNGRYNISYTSTSYGLIKDMQEILFSLGYVSTISKDNRCKKYKSGECYTLRINIPNEEKYKLFRLSRKKNIALQAVNIIKHRQYDRTSIKNITKMPYRENMVCIYVDNPEHLYLTNDYIVTHNTTIIPYIIDTLNISEEDVVYSALTGKAARVLREKGCENAMTLHKLLYIPKKIKDTDDVEFIPREYLEDNPKLIVVDEASMVSQEIFNLLLSHKVHIIFLGDNFQSPAIGDNAHILDNPHVVLTEITRQALDSPIIRLSMDIRDGKPLTYGGEKEAKIIPRKNVSSKLLLGANIVLCGKNETRRWLNTEIRKLKWGDKFQNGPIEGDKLICLRNYYKYVDQTGEEPLLNGSIGTISKLHTQNTKLLKPKLTAEFTDDLGNVFKKGTFNIDYQLLTTGVPRVNNDNFRDFYKVQRPLEFDYGNSITVYKSQGSQWDRVLVFAEQMGDKDFYYKWLYTGLTRAVKQCIIVL